MIGRDEDFSGLTETATGSYGKNIAFCIKTSQNREAESDPGLRVFSQ